MAFCDNASARTEHEGERTGAESDDEEEKVAAFLKRCDLDPVALDRIHEFARSRTGCEVERAPVQGYCSYTLLPREFGDVARGVMRAMDDIEGLPWVITHGDLVADNIMVESEGDGAGRLVGLIDWAEAEWLPFGVGLYGLEEVLGQDVGADDTDKTRFEYYPDAMELRAMFWVEVAKVVDDEDAIRTAKMAQVLGVLLWRGIAFDDGALSRVVDEEDWWDVQRLRTWLFDERGLGFTSERPAWWERTWRKLQGWVGWCLR
ncbi:hypothetical protein C8034_v008516 [Colletotrichum sidae]|uniref:Aminoglycoside phosphotransferase domain-containing protein n=1 Tax=Colletotrichum sidae TaxID=1347389 RepID=A0A4R8TRS2_9PEZI|nr:hypothetical protein C8034_v008516 [Colletotrichum sidae]